MKKQTLQQALSLIRDYVKSLPEAPGVYRMLSASEDVLYIGKAKSLRQRVTNYTNIHQLPHRLQRMVSLTVRMDFVVTQTEEEALLLEANMIKRHRPPYNILLKDAKSFAYILMKQHNYPRPVKYRGGQKEKGKYFGPFASTSAIHETLELVFKLFQLRSCQDHDFANRQRPCLQYHMKRCSAPCVGLISQEDYQKSVYQVMQFLRGNQKSIIKDIRRQMEAASANQLYERAAIFRDRLKALAHIHQTQLVNLNRIQDADVIGLRRDAQRTCIQVFFIRGRRNYGNRSFFPQHDPHVSSEEILEAFLLQFYAKRKDIPAHIFLSEKLEELPLIEKTLSQQVGHQISFAVPQRGEKKALVQQACHNADEALVRESVRQVSQKENLRRVKELFHLEKLPQRIEVYDNSHIQGTAAVGAMIVAGAEGFDKRSYRCFTIEGKNITPGDDYGMMRQVMRRRFQKEGALLPDLLLIDGGKGHLSAVEGVLADLGLTFPVVAIAKGVDRHAGRETFFISGKEPFQLPLDDPLLYYLQRLRDEAHRFGIQGHRQRRTKKMTGSLLDNIIGVGPQRRKALLKHFGSLQGVRQATQADLQKVPGITSTLAQKILDQMNDQ